MSNTYTITLPTKEELLAHKPQDILRVREQCDGKTPMAASHDYAKKGGVYIHVWKKSETERVILYVGVTSEFKRRLDRELTTSQELGSKKLIKELKKHIGKNDLLTVFYSDDDIQNSKMIPDSLLAGMSKEYRTARARLLVEQAMICAYYSADLVNEEK